MAPRDGSTGCGDDAFVALAAALPALTRLRVLRCEHNPAARSRGWVALAGALPALPALELIDADGCSGLGAGQARLSLISWDLDDEDSSESEGVAALVQAVPLCGRLRQLSVNACCLDDQARMRLHTVQAERAELMIVGIGML